MDKYEKAPLEYTREGVARKHVDGDLTVHGDLKVTGTMTYDKLNVTDSELYSFTEHEENLEPEPASETYSGSGEPYEYLSMLSDEELMIREIEILKIQLHLSKGFFVRKRIKNLIKINK